MTIQPRADVQIDPAAPTLRQVIAALAVGAAGLMITALSPMILGRLHHLGRLSAAEIGLAAVSEGLAMGVVCAVAGARLPPERIRAIAVCASLFTIAADLASMASAHGLFLAARAGAGLGEGLMLWTAIVVIARQPTPERTTAAFLTGQVIAALVLASAGNMLIAPRFGAPGLLGALATTAGLGAVLALFVPNALMKVPAGATTASGPLPMRGWVAMLVMLAFVAAGSGVYVYLDPIASLARLGPGAVGAAVQLNLVGQILGGLFVSLAAGRVRYPLVSAIAGAAALSVYTSYLLASPLPVFVLATGLTGFTGMVMTSFFVPLCVAADPSWRVASMSGGAQILGAAAGPLAAAATGSRTPLVILISMGWVSLSVALTLWLAHSDQAKKVIQI